MTKLICTTILLLSIVSCDQVKHDKDKERVEAVCDQFMQIFSDGDVSTAIRLLKQNLVMASSALDTLEGKITGHIENIFPIYGKIQSYEFIHKRKVKDFIAKHFYILKFDKYYLKFSFTLYNSGKGWTITAFDYDEDLIEVLY